MGSHGCPAIRCGDSGGAFAKLSAAETAGQERRTTTLWEREGRTSWTCSFRHCLWTVDRGSQKQRSGVEDKAPEACISSGRKRTTRMLKLKPVQNRRSLRDLLEGKTSRASEVWVYGVWRTINASRILLNHQAAEFWQMLQKQPASKTLFTVLQYFCRVSEAPHHVHPIPYGLVLLCTSGCWSLARVNRHVKEICQALARKLWATILQIEMKSQSTNLTLLHRRLEIPLHTTTKTQHLPRTPLGLDAQENARKGAPRSPKALTQTRRGCCLNLIYHLSMYKM